MNVTGIIIRRRSMGKHLAFADIKVLDSHHRHDYEDEDHIKEGDDNGGDIIHIAFRRASPSWDKARDDTFPTKNSLLPYGAKLSLQLCKRRDDVHIVDTKVSSNDNHGITYDNQAGTKKASSCWEVSSWEIVMHPHKIATDHARGQISGVCNTPDDDSQRENGGILCTAYLKSRADNFFEYHRNLTPKLKIKSKQRREMMDNNCRDANDRGSNAIIKNNGEKDIGLKTGPPSPSSYELQESHGGDKRSKALRAKIFSSWLLEKFGSDLLKKDGTNGVLDIAGGKGQLSIELSILAQVRCTIIDPQVRGKGGLNATRFSSKDMKRMKKNESPIPIYIAKYFGLGKEGGENSTLVHNSSCLVGLHPDECTEDILDAALHHKKSVAIVPCCVFPTFFPTRQLRSGKTVRTYDEFLCYLLEKDDRLNRETLPFEGKNQVIYYHEKMTKASTSVSPPMTQS